MQRHSEKRDAILACLRSTAEHPSAEWIYAKLKPQYPNLSLATVYRNLQQIKDAGLVCKHGSIGMPAAYHHLNNYGTTSMVVTMGVVHKEEVILPDETKAIRDILDIGTTVDERVADGFAFALAVKRLKTILAHPEILDRPFSVPSGESAGVS